MTRIALCAERLPKLNFNFDKQIPLVRIVCFEVGIHLGLQVKGQLAMGYDTYGLRVPAVVVSPWARRHHVSNVVHDHTSVLAFVERKWNLPALTYRDANAAPMLDFLDFRRPAFLTPPTLAAAPSPLVGRGCDTNDFPR